MLAEGQGFTQDHLD